MGGPDWFTLDGAMLTVFNVLRCVGAVALLGGSLVMAQSLEPQSLAPEDVTIVPNPAPTGQVADLGSWVNGSVQSASDSAASAAVASSADFQVNASPIEQRNQDQRNQNATAHSQMLLGRHSGCSASALVSYPHPLREAGNGSRPYARNCMPQAGRSMLQARSARIGNATASDFSDVSSEEIYSSAGLTDSTREAVLASPPDPGSASPVESGFGFAPGVAEMPQAFLHPNLRVGPRNRRARRENARGLRSLRPGAGSLAAASSSEALHPQVGQSLQDDLKPGISDQPDDSADPLASLEQQLDPDANQ